MQNKPHGNFIDLTGSEFNSFKVLSLDSSHKTYGSKWLCQCVCGTIKSVYAHNLKSGGTKSCGCLNRDDLTGKRYGKLTVIKLDHRSRFKSNNVVSKWLCRCDCGNEIVTLGGSLKSNRTQSTKSCGCIRLKNELGVRPFRQLLSRYKKQAKDRNLIWKLTENEFQKLTKQNCHYCGVDPSQITKTVYGKTKFKEHHDKNNYIYNGIDRIDSNLGYVLNNCVACCGTCNVAKNDLPYIEFKNWIKRIIEFNKAK
jgi:hypothetical protein